MIRFGLLTLGAFAFVSAWVATYLGRELELWKRVDYSNRGLHCKSVARCSVVGAEDLTYVADGVLIGGVDHRLRLWENTRFGPSNTPDGGLIAIKTPDDRTDDVRVQHLPLTGFPEGVGFHPHGIYYYRPDSKLYVVNHAYHRGGERIEVFQVETDPEVTVTYDHSITHPLLCTEANGILNDLVVVGPQDELFVTHYLALPDGLDGRASSSVISQLHYLLNQLAALTKAKLTRVLYCRRGVCRATEGGDGGYGFNGINVSPDGKRLLVADMKSVHVLDIARADREGSRHRLERRQIVPTKHVVDNIEPVATSAHGAEAYTLGSVGHIYQFLVHNHGYSLQETPERSTRFNISGGVQTVVYDKDTDMYAATEVMMQDGSELTGVSSAVSVRGGHYLLGSWCDKGLLYCRREGGGEDDDNIHAHLESEKESSATLNEL